MPLLETVAFAIGPVLAKAVIKSFTDDDLINDISGTLVDLLKDSGEKSAAQRRQIKQLDKMAQEVADNMRVIFQHASIEKESRTVVAEEFAQTLATASITSEKLIRFHLDPKPLESYLSNCRPEATKYLGLSETDYYTRMLYEASKAIMAIALEVDDFERQFTKTMLVSQDEILEIVTRLIQNPDKEAKEFEDRYCGIVCKELDRLETFGIRQMDSVTSRQSLFQT